MPIIERTPAACYDRFLDHLRPLVAKVITSQPLVCVRITDDDRQRTLEFADARAVPITTHFGRLHFYMAQRLVTEADVKMHRLATRQYWYRIQPQPDGRAVIRWEYDRDTDSNRHARHHVQIRSTAELGNGDHLDLDKLHTPTGWVTIEEVARFLVHDLGVTPPCGDSWPKVLAASERAFYEDFTSKRYRKP